jgi:NADPH2:quinone reductase
VTGASWPASTRSAALPPATCHRPEDDERAALELSSGDLIFKQTTVRGFWGSAVSRTMDPATRERLFAELAQRIGEGALTLPVSSTHAFEDVHEAVRASLTPGRVGKVQLRP